MNGGGHHEMVPMGPREGGSHQPWPDGGSPMMQQGGHQMQQGMQQGNSQQQPNGCTFILMKRNLYKTETPNGNKSYYSPCEAETESSMVTKIILTSEQLLRLKLAPHEDPSYWHDCPLRIMLRYADDSGPVLVKRPGADELPLALIKGAYNAPMPVTDIQTFVTEGGEVDATFTLAATSYLHNKRWFVLEIASGDPMRQPRGILKLYVKARATSKKRKGEGGDGERSPAGGGYPGSPPGPSQAGHAPPPPASRPYPGSLYGPLPAATLMEAPPYQVHIGYPPYGFAAGTPPPPSLCYGYIVTARDSPAPGACYPALVAVYPYPSGSSPPTAYGSMGGGMPHFPAPPPASYLAAPYSSSDGREAERAPGPGPASLAHFAYPYGAAPVPSGGPTRSGRTPRRLSSAAPPAGTPPPPQQQQQQQQAAPQYTYPTHPGAYMAPGGYGAMMPGYRAPYAEAVGPGAHGGGAHPHSPTLPPIASLEGSSGGGPPDGSASPAPPHGYDLRQH